MRITVHVPWYLDITYFMHSPPTPPLPIPTSPIFAGLYEDSSVSSVASEDAPAVCECGNIVQLEVDLDEQIHAPSETYVAHEFTPDIHETQEVVSSPRSSRIHGKETKSVFDRLYHDKDQRERKLIMERNRIEKDEDRELTFRPKTNIKHPRRKKKNSTDGSGGADRKKKKKSEGTGRARVFCQQCLDEQNDQKNSGRQAMARTGTDANLQESDSPAEILARVRMFTLFSLCSMLL